MAARRQRHSRQITSPPPLPQHCPVKTCNARSRLACDRGAGVLGLLVDPHTRKARVGQAELGLAKAWDAQQGLELRRERVGEGRSTGGGLRLGRSACRQAYNAAACQRLPSQMCPIP